MLVEKAVDKFKTTPIQDLQYGIELITLINSHLNVLKIQPLTYPCTYDEFLAKYNEIPYDIRESIISKTTLTSGGSSVFRGWLSMIAAGCVFIMFVMLYAQGILHVSFLGNFIDALIEANGQK